MGTVGQVSDDRAMQADMVFEGGGVKGIGLAGAFRALTDAGHQPQCVAGTSAGAITAALVAVGYSGAELEDIVLHDMNFRNFEDRALLGPLGELTEFARHRGMHSGEYFLNWMRERVAAKGIRTFGELRNPGASPERLYRLQVIVSDLSGRRMLVLPRDATHLGVDPDQLEIAEAVRMSMSIPVFFRPVVVVDDRSGNQHVLVDGGMLSNFPVWLFDAPKDTAPAFPTFGLLLVAPGQKAGLDPAPVPPDQVAPIGSDAAFFTAMADTMMQAHDRFYLDDADYARTIASPTLGVRTTQFDITPAEASALFESGRSAAQQFLAGWDFRAYVQRFRSPAAAGAPT